MRTALALTIAALTTFAYPAAAQENLPDGWHARADDGTPVTGLSFVDMPPGWHITTGPSVILYNPERVASGTYTVRSESFLFDPGTRREAYGIFVGGARLDADDQRYTYFLIRRTGEFIVKRRNGATVVTLRDWTPHPAILQYDKRGDSHSARNLLGIDVTSTDVVFLVNDTEVARLPRTEVDAEGIVGLRINHALNVHVTSLEVTPSR